MRRILTAICAAALLSSLAVTAAFGGEVTGNGKLLTVHGHSSCAFSGQEDLQFFTDDSDATAKPVATRGEPGHAQSWGQIPKVVRDTLLIPMGQHPGIACNPTRSTGEE